MVQDRLKTLVKETLVISDAIKEKVEAANEQQAILKAKSTADGATVSDVKEDMIGFQLKHFDLRLLDADLRLKTEGIRALLEVQPVNEEMFDDEELKLLETVKNTNQSVFGVLGEKVVVVNQESYDFLKEQATANYSTEASLTEGFEVLKNQGK